MLDLPGFTKFEVTGAGAPAWLDHMVAGVVPKPGPHGAQLFPERHGRHRHRDDADQPRRRPLLADQRRGGRAHDEHWLREHLPADGSVRIDNVSARYGSLIVVGPKSRELLAQLTRADLSNEAFPWLSVRTIDIGYTRAIALRVNYVGELGWELHVPAEHVLSVYDLIWAAGEPLGIADYGLYAMDSLRLEKCYRAWKGDLTTEYTPFMASLDRFVKLDKPGGFIGQAGAAPRGRSPGRTNASCRCWSMRVMPMPPRCRSSTTATRWSAW